MDTDPDSDFSDRPPVDIFVEEGELSDQDPDVTATEPDQTLSEEQKDPYPRYGHTGIPGEPFKKVLAFLFSFFQEKPFCKLKKWRENFF